MCTRHSPEYGYGFRTLYVPVYHIRKLKRNGYGSTLMIGVRVRNGYVIVLETRVRKGYVRLFSMYGYVTGKDFFQDWGTGTGKITESIRVFYHRKLI